MQDIFTAYSTNGRWGLSIVSSDFEALTYGNPVQATVFRLGKTEGRDVLRLDATDKPQWVVVLGDAQPLAGASEVLHVSLQSSRYVTVLLLSEMALVKTLGYKGRSSSVHCYQNGRRADIPSSVLLGLGLLGGTKPEEVPPPPSFEVEAAPAEVRSALAEALIAAGIAA